eukprot:362326-Chlamydomonas_euryale.AAC.4
MVSLPGGQDVDRDAAGAMPVAEKGWRYGRSHEWTRSVIWLVQPFSVLTHATTCNSDSDSDSCTHKKPDASVLVA